MAPGYGDEVVEVGEERAAGPGQADAHPQRSLGHQTVQGRHPAGRIRDGPDLGHAEGPPGKDEILRLDGGSILPSHARTQIEDDLAAPLEDRPALQQPRYEGAIGLHGHQAVEDEVHRLTIRIPGHEEGVQGGPAIHRHPDGLSGAQAPGEAGSQEEEAPRHGVSPIGRSAAGLKSTPWRRFPPTPPGPRPCARRPWGGSPPRSPPASAPLPAGWRTGRRSARAPRAAASSPGATAPR